MASTPPPFQLHTHPVAPPFLHHYIGPALGLAIIAGIVCVAAIAGNIALRARYGNGWSGLNLVAFLAELLCAFGILLAVLFGAH